jgi:transcriptional regulator with XRE-family HTH domain
MPAPIMTAVLFPGNPEGAVSVNLVELAERIKTFRLDQRLTLQQVASRTGLTRSWLSKVENFRVTPSLPALGRIAESLGVTVAQLVEGLENRPNLVVTRKGEGKMILRDSPKSKTVYESLAHEHTGRKMDPFLLRVPPGDVHRAAMPHEGEEFLMVFSGQIDFEYDDQVHTLRKGDSLYFNAAVKHRVLNRYTGPAELLCVFYGQGDS